jgi:membrane protein
MRQWMGVLLRVWEDISKDRVFALAGGVAYYGLLALFPAIAALVALYGLFADPTTIVTHLDSLSGVLPGGGIEVLRDELTRISESGNRVLSITFLAGLTVSLWSANAGMKALFDALNIAFKVEEKRSFIKLNAISLAYTVGAIGFAILALSAIVVVPVLLNYVGLGSLTGTLLTLLRWPALLVAVMLWLSLIYWHGPSREKSRWHWITLGCTSAALLWLIASLLFSWYAGSFGSYNKTYGSLGAVIGFMVWMWISVIVVLLGAELDAETERERDGGHGEQQSLGHFDYSPSGTPSNISKPNRTRITPERPGFEQRTFECAKCGDETILMDPIRYGRETPWNPR